MFHVERSRTRLEARFWPVWQICPEGYWSRCAFSALPCAPEAAVPRGTFRPTSRRLRSNAYDSLRPLGRRSPPLDACRAASAARRRDEVRRHIIPSHAPSIEESATEGWTAPAVSGILLSSTVCRNLCRSRPCIGSSLQLSSDGVSPRSRCTRTQSCPKSRDDTLVNAASTSASNPRPQIDPLVHSACGW